MPIDSNDRRFNLSMGDRNAHAQRMNVAETSSLQDAPAPAAMTPAIGRVNSALIDLIHRRDRLTPRQASAVDSMEKFYANTHSPCTNAEIFGIPAPEQRRRSKDTQVTLQRRASFLLNMEAFVQLPHALNEVPAQAGLIGHSNATLMINAITNSVKSQIEHVNAAALQDAQRGDRVCPMALQPEKFNAFLQQNAQSIDELVQACQSPIDIRNVLLKRSLETLANSYFQNSTGYPGAPPIRPDSVVVSINHTEPSTMKRVAPNQRTAFLSIDCDNIKEFCNNPLPKLDDCEDFKTIYRARLLQGFDNHTPVKKQAAILIQLLIQEMAELQESSGALERDIRSYGQPAKHAAKRTVEELFYKGREKFGDHTVKTRGKNSQRTQITQGINGLWAADRAFENKYHTSLILHPQIRKWIHSPEMIIDLRGLAEPSGRLLFQTSPLTGDALLRTPTFRRL